MKRKLTWATVLTLLYSNCGVHAEFFFGEPMKLPAPINLPGTWDSTASMSPDGLEIFFESNRAGWGTLVATRENIADSFDNVNTVVTADHPSLSDDGLTLILNTTSTFGAKDIVMMTRDSVNERFDGRVENLGGNVNSSADERWGSLSPNGLELYFTRSRPNDEESADIWVATRSDTSLEFEPATRLPSPINTDLWDDSPSVSPDGLALFFSSFRDGGHGGSDLWVSTRSNLNSNWRDPVNLGPEINTPFFDWQPELTKDGKTLLFSQANEGAVHADSEIWQAPLIITYGDLNRNGHLDADDIDILSTEIAIGSTSPFYDLNQDTFVNDADRKFWVEQKSIAYTFFGDANLDGEFNSSDLVHVFIAREYEDDIVGNSTWATGDWNGDREFDMSDFVLAFQAGGYERGPRREVQTVPEPPGNALLLLFGVCGCFALHRAWMVKRAVLHNSSDHQIRHHSMARKVQPRHEELEVRRCLSAMSFVPHVSSFPDGVVRTSEMQLADMDGDGDLDLFTLKPPHFLYSSEVSWYENMAGTFRRHNLQFKSVTNADLADVNGDGNVDIVTAERASARVGERVAWYSYDEDNGTFQLQEEMDTEDITGITSVNAYDLDSDGDSDVLATISGQIFWFENVDGQGKFERMPFDGGETFRHTEQVASIEVTDFEKDGHIDVFALVAVSEFDDALVVDWGGHIWRLPRIRGNCRRNSSGICQRIANSRCRRFWRIGSACSSTSILLVHRKRPPRVVYQEESH